MTADRFWCIRAVAEAGGRCVETYTDLGDTAVAVRRLLVDGVAELHVTRESVHPDWRPT